MNELLIATQKTSAVEVDPYYNLVSLHLKGDVNTGRSYNAFSDASSNNFRLTNNGDVRGSSFSPYGTSWSGYFDGTGDFLTVTDNASNSLDLGAGQFCVEFWWYPQSVAAGQYPLIGDSSGNWYVIWDNNAGTNAISLGRRATGNDVNTTGFTLAANTWQHIVVTRQSTGTNDTRIFVDGVLRGIGTSSQNYAITTTLGIGGTSTGTGLITGNLASVRLIKGSVPTEYQTSVTATGTQVFFSPTSPLTAVANTNLLVCHTNRFIDGSSNQFAITRNGDTRISSFSPFLDSDTTSGSGYFDGTGDSLAVSSNAVSATGAFTIEAWIFPTSSTANQCVIAQYSGNAGRWQILFNATGKFELSGASTYLATTGTYTAINVWYHVVFQRDISNNLSVYVNGKRDGTGTNAVSLETTATYIGDRNTGGTPFFGYISDLKVSNTAIYSGTDITVPTTKASSAASTALLTLQERGAYNTIGFQDESEYQHVITRNGNVAQGTFSPFSNSGWSNLFNGSTDCLSVASHADFNFGSGNFTAECWVNWNTASGNADQVIFAFGSSGQTEAGFRLVSNNTIVLDVDESVRVSYSFVPTVGTWYHFAVVRDAANTYKIYQDGVLKATGTYTYTQAQIGLFIGGINWANNYGVNGYISNFRAVKGVAVYTGAFTPPTAPLTTTQSAGTNISAITGSATSILTLQSNRFVDNSVSPKTITVVSAPRVTPFSPFAPVAYDPAVHGGSAYFDGSTDSLSFPSSSAFALGSSADFCIEGWIYSTGTPGTDAVIAGTWQNGSSAFANRWLLSLRTSGTAIYWWDSTGSPGITYTGITVNQWVHIAVVRSSGTITLYVNGVARGTQTANQAYTTQDVLRLGGGISGTSDFPGYISSFRVVVGSPVYTGNFTPPSGPLPLLGNTSLLLNFTNGGVIDSTGKNVIETVGNSGVVTTTIKKFGSGSMYFDGNVDVVRMPSSDSINFGSGNWTMEFWMYTGNLSTRQDILDRRASATVTGWMLWMNGTAARLAFYTSFGWPFITSNTDVIANTWTHVAVVRNGSSFKMYQNGVEVASGTSTSAMPDDNTYLRIGTSVENANYYNGYIDDLRITKGYARYVTGTGANAGKMVFNGTNTLALPTKALPNRAVASTATTSLTAPTSVEALVVGGGGGAGGQQGGGGGAGGFREFMGGNAIAVSANNSYRITVGSSGSGGASGAGATSGTSGGSSIFSTFTSEGGGGGGTVSTSGLNGGSGGGGGHQSPGTSLGGLGNRVAGTTTVVPTQGNNGGDSNPNATNYYAGGGGGAGGVGQNGSPNNGNGGLAQTSSITGTSIYYAGGGGAGSRGGTAGLGGGTATTANKGGGGDGSASGIGLSALTNTGGGGGGGAYAYNGGNGGSGVVILAYPITNKPLTASLGLVYTIDTVTRPGYRVYKFVAGTGTISW